MVRAKIALGVHYIDKPLFLKLFFEAYTKTFSSKNITSSFAAAGLVLLNLDQVLSWLQVRVQTPSPIPALDQLPSTLPLKTLSNVIELDYL